MKKSLLTLLLFFSIFLCAGQKQANIWYFGEYAGLNFNAGAPVPLLNGQLDTYEGSASIADKTTGAILFYTDGTYVWDATGAVMLNGAGLGGNASSTQSAVIVPLPGSTTIYYIFTVDAQAGYLGGSDGGLNCNIVDMTLNGGLGNLSTKDSLMVTPTDEKVTAVRHCNGRDIWLVTHLWNSDAFYAYLITPAGISAPVISNSGIVHQAAGSGINAETIGYMKFSPDAKHLALACYFNLNTVQLFDFDNSTGIISNPATDNNFVNISGQDGPYGISFSPDNSRLYAGVFGFDGTNSLVYQYNMLAGSGAAIIASRTLIASEPNYGIGALQIAPDGKIYVAHNYELGDFGFGSGSNYIDVINNPNGLGAACNYVFNGQNLGLTGVNLSWWGLPDMVESFLIPPYTVTATYPGCQSDIAISFTDSLNGIIHVSWDFGDPSSGTSDTSTLQNPTHIFSGNGTYTVTVQITNNCKTDVFTQSITINTSPVIGVSPSAPIICNGQPVSLTGSGGVTYTWSPSTGLSGTTGTTVSANPSSTTTYTVTGTNGTGCTNTASVTVTVNPSLTVGATVLPSATLCAGGSVTLSGTGATTYSWSGGVTNGVSFVPVSTSTYTVTGTTSGCSNTATVTVTVNPLPTVGATAVPSTVCAGGSVTLSGTGATTYSWSGGVTNGVSFVPASTATYTVTGTTNGCSNTATASVTVNPLPTVGATAIPSTVCAGSSVTLSGTGATTYSWSGGVTNGVSFVPVSTSTYTVTGTTNGCSNTATATVTVNLLPTVGATAVPSTICAGGSVTLSGTGATTYSWSGGVTNGVSFVPVSTSTYTVTGTTNGCSNTATVTVTVNTLPVVNAVALPSSTVCAGGSVTLSGAGATTYSWSGGVTNGVSFVPVSTGTYTVTGTTNGCSNTATVTITVNPIPTVGATALPSTTVCPGSSVTLNGTGATTYSWSGGVTNGVAFTPASTATYTVTGTTNGCSNTAVITVTVSSALVINATALPSATLCTGSSVTLSGTGATTYSWSGGVTNGVSFVPVSTATYTVTGTTSGCSNTATITVTVNPLPTVGAIAIPSTVCAGSSVTLSGTGATTYNWSGGVTNGVSFVPVSTSTYTVTGTTNGCSNTATASVTVNPLPTVGATAIPSTVCAGSSVTLSGTGATTYSWSGGVTNGVSFVPVSTSTYTVTGTTNGCSNTATATVTVNLLPTVGATAVPSTICAGGSVTLSGTGATTYSWSDGVTNGVSFVPVSTSTYTVTGTTSGCSNTATVTVTVNALPVVNALALPSSTVCAGGSVTLSGTGATTYSWSGGVTNGVSFVPVSTTTYTVTGTTNGCSNTATITVTVNSLPIVGATAFPSTTICSGSSVTLNGTGATTYIWTGGVTNGVSFVPVSTDTYTVTGTTNGCSNTASITVTVNSLPAVNAIALPATTICAGASVTLSGTGATIYSWSGGMTDGVSFAPASTATYTVTGTTNGCSNTATVTITVNPIPTVGAIAFPSTTVCPGSSVTLSGTGATTYSWSGGVTNGVPFTPVSTATYTVTGTTNGCSNTAAITVTVSSTLVINAVALPSATICAGSSVTLSGTGATTYSWSGGVTNGVSFVPASTSTYTVTGTTNGCSNTGTITITVNSLPVVNAVAIPSGAICAGSSVALSGTGATTYSWSGGVTDGVSFVPASTDTYTVTGTTNGCSNTAAITVTVTPLPDVGATAFPSITVCAGASVTLSGTGATTYSWSGGVTNGISFVPASTDTYTVTGTTAGCSNTAAITVTVNSLPTVNAGVLPAPAVCAGTSVTLNGTGATTYSWSGSVTNGVAFVPAFTYTYTVTGTTNGCSNTATITVTVNSLPDVGTTALPSDSICAGGSVTLGGTGATTYNWTGGVTNGVSFVPASTNTYTVTGTDGNSCTNTASIIVTVNPPPVVNTGPDANICPNDSAQIVVTGAPQGSIYTWTPSTNLSCNCSNPYASPRITTTYTVSVTTPAGCSASDSVSVIVTPLSATAGPDTAVCYGNSVQLYANGGTSYQWTPSTGLSDPDISNPAATPLDSTVYTVTVSTGACNATATVTIIVHPAVLPPVISQSGDTLFCSLDSMYVSYQWYYNDTIISNATKTFYIATQSGNYNIAVSDRNGCLISVGINIILAGVQSISERPEQIILSPNPAADELLISGYGSAEKCSIIVFNAIGEKVQEENIIHNNHTALNISNLSSGVYFIRIEKPNSKWAGRFVKE